MYDADKAGEAATLRALDSLLENELNLKIVRLPAGHDPDTLVRKEGPQEFTKLLNKSQDFFDFKLGLLCQRHAPATTNGKAAIAKEMFASIALLKNDIVRYDYLRRLAIALLLKEEALIAEFRKLKPADNLKVAATHPPSPNSNCAPMAEKVLIKSLGSNPKTFNLIKNNVKIDDFTAPQTRRIAEYFFNNYDGQDLERFIACIEDSQASSFLSGVLLDENIPLDKEIFKSSLLKIRRVKPESKHR